MANPAGKVTRQGFAWALNPAIQGIYQKTTDGPLIESQINRLFKTGTMDGATKEYFSGLTGLGGLKVKAEGDAIEYAVPAGGRPVKYVAETLALGIRVTYEMKADNKIDLIREMVQMLAMASKSTPELDAALVFALGFGAKTAGQDWNSTTWSSTTQTYKGADGVSLFNASHPILGTARSHRGLLNFPSTYSNLLSTALTETSLTSALDLFRRMPNSEGRPAGMKPKFLVVPTGLEFTARQLLNSGAAVVSPVDGSSANANEKIPTKFANSGLQLVVWDDLPDQNDWFVTGNPDDPRYKLRFLYRERPGKPVPGDDFDTGDAKWRVLGRWACGYDDAMGVVGSRV